MALKVNTLVKLHVEDDGCCIGHFDMNGEDGTSAIFEFGCVGMVTEVQKVTSTENAIPDMYIYRVHWAHTCPNHKQYEHIRHMKPEAHTKGTWHDSCYLWEIGYWGDPRTDLDNDPDQHVWDYLDGTGD